MTDRIEQIAQLKVSMETLEAQRSTLGDMVVDASFKGLRLQLAEWETEPSTASPAEGERRQATILFSDMKARSS